MYPLPCLNLITLITYLFPFLLFTCLACHRASLCSPTIALTLYLTRCVGLSTYVILSFLFFLFFAPIVFLLSSSRQTEKKNSPLGSCHPLFHFSPFTLPFTFLTSFSQLASLPACCCCAWASVRRNCPCQFVRVSWTEGVVCLFATPPKGRVDR